MDEPPYRVRRSGRARRARVVVSAAGVEVVLPAREPAARAGRLVAEKRQWIERTLRRLRAAEAALPPPRLMDGGAVPYLGRALALKLSAHPETGRARVRDRDDTLEVFVGSGAEAEVRAALEAWYRGRARLEVGRRLDAACARTGSGYRRLEIRAQRTRWASCSSSGTMSFNWRLLLAPAAVLDYVVEHEVAHLAVADHSPRFWALLESRCPDCRAHERWLRLNGAALRL